MSLFLNGLAAAIALCIIWSCEAIVDEYEIVDDTSNGADGDSDSDSDGDSDSDADGDFGNLIECGKIVAPPLGDDIEFCTIEKTSFFVGCDESYDTCLDNELPKHQTTLSAYMISVTETTVDSFRNFILDQSEWAKGGTSALGDCDASYLQNWTETTPPAGTLDLPVLGVCWHAADAFCKWLGEGFHLPTEAQWETAARGGHDGEEKREYWVYPFEGPYSCTKANYLGCYSIAVDVGSLAGVSFGNLYDMAGNAWEWTNDWYKSDYYCDPDAEGLYLYPECNEDFTWTDPQGPADGTKKILRGGSWFSDANQIRTAKRDNLAPNVSSNMAGFRCAFD